MSNFKSESNSVNPTLNDAPSDLMHLENWVIFRLSGYTGKVIADICGMALPTELTPDAFASNYYVAMGDVNKHPDPDIRPGSTIFTSPIAECSGNQIRTRSGSVYELGTKHPDFVAFAEAAEKYPVLDNWELGTASMSANSDDPKRVYIKGTIRGSDDKTEITKLIAAQEDTVITCHDGKKYCIDWCAVNCFQKFMLQVLASPLEGQHGKIKPMFSYFGYDISQRCNFLEINWESYCSAYRIPFAKSKDLWHIEDNV